MKDEKNNFNHPLVSIVIPTHNRKEKLCRLIDSILCSNYPLNKIEIIVVDDASTDRTYEHLTKKYQKLIPKTIKIFRNDKNMFSSYCRNIGTLNSQGDYIFYVDDDNVMDKECIKNLVKILENDKGIGVAGPLMLYYNNPEIIWCGGKA